MLERVVFRLFAFLSLLNFAFRRIFPENNLVFFYQHIALVFAIRQAANVGAKVFILAVLPHAKERAIAPRQTHAFTVFFTMPGGGSSW